VSMPTTVTKRLAAVRHNSPYSSSLNPIAGRATRGVGPSQVTLMWQHSREE
jgi:hypothetical protein